VRNINGSFYFNRTNSKFGWIGDGLNSVR